MLATDMRGVVPPLLTPIHSVARVADEAVDVASLRRLARYVLDAGCHGLFVQGSSGEFITLPPEQRRTSISAAVEEAAGSVPVLAGIAAASLAEAVANAEMAAECGADAAVATTPYYFTYSQGELIQYFTRLADSIPLPLVIYNIPQRTGNPLRPDTIVALADHPHIIGLKDTSENLMAMTRMIAALRGRDDFALFTGTETLLAPSILLGAHGGVLGAANIAPHLSVKLYNAALAGDLPRVRELQDQMEDVFRVFLTYSYGEPSIGAGLGGLKLAASLLGFGDARMCFPAALPGDCEPMRRLIASWVDRGIITPPSP